MESIIPYCAPASTINPEFQPFKYNLYISIEPTDQEGNTLKTNNYDAIVFHVKESTGIDAVLAERTGDGTSAADKASGAVYDLQGRKVAECYDRYQSKGSLPKGIYIVGGRKVVVNVF